MVRGRPNQRRGGPLRGQSAAQRRRQRPVIAKTPIDGLILHLRDLRSAVLVAIAALRLQNCELDEDVATLLQRCVCDSIADQLERLEAGRRSPARMRRV